MLSQYLNTHRIFKRLAMALIRLRVCAGWSEPLLVAHTTLLEISCRGSYQLKDILFPRFIRHLITLKPIAKVIVSFSGHTQLL